MVNKKAQEGGVGMSFGFLFSIILIIFFVFAAIWGIKIFLDWGNCSEVGLFYDRLQQKVDEAYQSSSSDFEFEFKVGKIEKICFANLSQTPTGILEDYEEIRGFEFYDSNTFLLPIGKTCDIPHKKINHINLSQIIRNSNPYCITSGTNIRIKKDFYDKSVVLS